MFAALILGQALAYGAPYYPVECDCPQASYEQPHEEVRLNGDFFIGEGGVGPAYAAPVYSGVGFVLFDDGGFDGRFGRRFGDGFGGGFGGGQGFARAGAGAFASASASASAHVSVRVTGGFRGGHKVGGHGGAR